MCCVCMCVCVLVRACERERERERVSKRQWLLFILELFLRGGVIHWRNNRRVFVFHFSPSQSLIRVTSSLAFLVIATVNQSEPIMRAQLTLIVSSMFDFHSNCFEHSSL